MSLSDFMGAMTTICGVDEGFKRIFWDDLIKAKAKDQQKYTQALSSRHISRDQNQVVAALEVD